jgi:SAM-dependent methyltransferase
MPHGWLVRLLRRIVRGTLGMDLDALEERIRSITQAMATLEKRLPETQALGVALGATLQELQRHLEARIDQTLSEAEDVRSAYLATRAEFENARDHLLPELSACLDRMSATVQMIQREVEAVRDRRLPRSEEALTGLQKASEAMQGELESLRDEHVPHVEKDLLRLQGAIDGLQKVTGAVQALGEELRDGRLPALAARTDALVGALHEDLTALGGLVDRMAQGEPLRVAVEPGIEAEVPRAVAAASTRFVDTFRGTRTEILGRAADYVPWLAAAGPVLDLGCGRGELLEALRDAGVEAQGVDSDPAMVAACRRLGLPAAVGDALATLRGRTPGSLGAVTCIHVFEHLPAAAWMSIVEAAAAALRPGGLLLVESPNPDSLRVGAGLFWADPTHRAPVHPQALEFVLRALGFEVLETELLRPFPADQALARSSQPEAVRELAGRLDAWLSGPRDYVVLARKP